VQNLLFGITIFVFNAFTNFSGQYMYSDVYMTLFNVVFTALTPIVIGLFDKDVDKGMCLKYPALYKEGADLLRYQWQVPQVPCHVQKRKSFAEI
jgi:magnesium-transporting ATPase (P-type)